MRPLRVLVFIALLIGSSLLFLSPSAHAITKSGNINVSGILAGPPPDTAPVIEEPANNSTFSNKTITVKGSCVADLVVRVYKNNIFAGSTLCQTTGTFELSIDLFVGKNILVARQFDFLDRPSPESNNVTVFYTPPNPPPLPPSPEPEPQPQPGPSGGSTGPSKTPPNIAQFQLVIDYDYTLQAIYTNQPFYLPVVFSGGTAPYALSIDWGDGTQTVLSRGSTKKLLLKHIYKEPGYYTASITVSDKKNERAHVQFVLLVSGEPKYMSGIESFVHTSPIWTWVLIICTSIIALSVSYRIGYKKGVKNAVKKPSKK